jgi:hypothetical protein
MQAHAPDPPVGEDLGESPARALVRLLEQHGLEASLREILDSIQARKEERQQKARFELLEHLLEGQGPITEEELQAARREWQG